MADLNKIIDELSTLTVVEAAELSKQLEEKWGVTAAAPAAAAPAGGAAAPAGEEKSEFSILLSSSSIEGDERSSFFVIFFSLVCCSTIGASKKVAQPINTTVESTIAINTFLKSIYFLPFFKFGAGSKPLPPPRNLIG